MSRGAVGSRLLSPTIDSANLVSTTILSGRTAGSALARRARSWAAHTGAGRKAAVDRIPGTLWTSRASTATCVSWTPIGRPAAVTALKKRPL